MVISRITLSISKKLVENLKMRNNSVRGVKRRSRGMGKKRRLRPS